MPGGRWYDPLKPEFIKGVSFPPITYWEMGGAGGPAGVTGGGGTEAVTAAGAACAGVDG
jgi:hypothetical protein